MTPRTTLVAAFAAIVFAGQAKADYTVTLSGLSPTTNNFNGTLFTFAPPASSQTALDGIAQSFNVINVGEGMASGAGTGSVTLSEDFMIVGSNGTIGSLTGTISGTFSVTGALSSFTNATISNLSGSGFSVGSILYSQPSPNTTPGSSGSGNVSLVVTPTTAVPEPASIAMLGLGLAGAGFAARRRSAR